MAGLNDMPSNPLVNMGLGLMQAAAPFGNVGTSLMNANQQTLQNQQARQNLGMNRMQMQMLQAKLPVLQSYFQRAQGMMNRAPNGAAPTAPTTGGPAPNGMSIDPQDALDTGTLGAMVGAPGAAELAKYPENYTKVQEAIQTQRKMQLQGPMAVLDSVRTSPNAHVLLQNMPDLATQYSQDAPKLGLPADPTQATPLNARTWATYAYNGMAGNAGVAPKDMPAQVLKQNRGNGDVRDIDALTGKDVGGSPAVATSKFVQNGQVVELPTAQGVAQKLQPYDSALYAAGLITPQAKEQAYQLAKSKGDLTEAIAGRDPIAAGQLSSYIAKRAGEEGISGLQLAANQQSYKSRQGVLNDFTTGGSSDKITAINTAVLHTNALLPLIDALQTKNLTRINAAKQAYQKETGVAAPTNYETLANMAVGEINSAINKNGGDVAERERITAPFKSSGGPDVLKGAVKTAVTALAGKTESLANRWDVGTEGNQGNFGKFLMPQTAKALGWTVHKDANGNKALVSPDGKYFKQL